MRVLIAIILLSSSFASPAQTKDFENYLKQVERNAKGLATMYFGVGTHVTGFEQVPGGAFHFLAHKETGEQYSLYLLPDMETIIQGNALSKHITSIDDAHKIPALEAIAIANKKKQELADETKKHFDKLKKGTASALLDGNFEDQTRIDKDRVYKPSSSSEFANSTKDDGFSDYKSLSGVTFGEGNKNVYVFVDLNCPACQHEFNFILKSAKSHQTKVTFIPVAFVKPKDSVDKAVALLSVIENSERQALLHRLIQNQPFSALVNDSNTSTREGALALKANMAAFFDQPSPVTPYIVALTERGYQRIGTTNRDTIEKLFVHSIPSASSMKQSEARDIQQR